MAISEMQSKSYPSCADRRSLHQRHCISCTAPLSAGAILWMEMREWGREKKSCLCFSSASNTTNTMKTSAEEGEEEEGGGGVGDARVCACTRGWKQGFQWLKVHQLRVCPCIAYTAHRMVFTLKVRVSRIIEGACRKGMLTRHSHALWLCLPGSKLLNGPHDKSEDHVFNHPCGSLPPLLPSLIITEFIISEGGIC